MNQGIFYNILAYSSPLPNGADKEGGGGIHLVG